eukprot:TRINITY_DN13759_c0_g1_i1.p1 TRINITY_DN13759_c0_g1~~TRINITY_DN13759_c0_g1_i1.p1  ORF type:complete len:247 (-),score=8.17 TRINITY_DN13759_c0_g1_i1:183-863(-)
MCIRDRNDALIQQEYSASQIESKPFSYRTCVYCLYYNTHLLSLRFLSFRTMTSPLHAQSRVYDGHFEDPRHVSLSFQAMLMNDLTLQVQELALFLEHMLFLGVEKFPIEKTENLTPMMSPELPKSGQHDVWFKHDVKYLLDLFDIAKTRGKKEESHLCSCGHRIYEDRQNGCSVYTLPSRRISCDLLRNPLKELGRLVHMSPVANEADVKCMVSISTSAIREAKSC